MRLHVWVTYVTSIKVIPKKRDVIKTIQEIIEQE